MITTSRPLQLNKSDQQHFITWIITRIINILTITSINLIINNNDQNQLNTTWNLNYYWNDIKTKLTNTDDTESSWNSSNQKKLSYTCRFILILVEQKQGKTYKHPGWHKQGFPMKPIFKIGWGLPLSPQLSGLNTISTMIELELTFFDCFE